MYDVPTGLSLTNAPFVVVLTKVRQLSPTSASFLCSKRFHPTDLIKSHGSTAVQDTKLLCSSQLSCSETRYGSWGDMFSALIGFSKNSWPLCDFYIVFFRAKRRYSPAPHYCLLSWVVDRFYFAISKRLSICKNSIHICSCAYLYLYHVSRVYFSSWINLTVTTFGMIGISGDYLFHPFLFFM